MIDEQGSKAGVGPRNPHQDPAGAAAGSAAEDRRNSGAANTAADAGAGFGPGAAPGGGATASGAGAAASGAVAAESGAGAAASGAGAARSGTAFDAEAGAAADGEAAARIAELEVRCAELNDRYLRAVAETENVRRRGQEEVAKANKYGIESFAEALLPVRDSLELALRSDSPSVENIREGVETTLRLLATVFERNKLVEIDPAGQKFDPNVHQAISTVPRDSVNPPVAPSHVVTVLQKGYLINDRVLRPALVTVAQA